MEIQVKNLDHLGIVAGIDAGITPFSTKLRIVEEIDRQIEQHPLQIISTDQVVTTRAFSCTLKGINACRRTGLTPKRLRSRLETRSVCGSLVKAMILNGLGFVSAPLYLFSEFFVGKATEHLLGERSH